MMYIIKLVIIVILCEKRIFMLYTVYFLIILVGVCLISIILRLLVKKKLNESNAVLWIFIGFIIILAGIFPSLVTKLSNFFLITYPPAFVFTVAIIILLFIVLKNTIINSELTAKIQETAMETSILRQELHEVKKKLDHLQHQKDENKNEGSESY